jgi:hypothetical protein
MVPGTVTMSLADIDKLRNDVKEAQNQLKTVEKEKEEIKAEKRVLKITITKHYSQSNKYLIEEFIRYASAEHRFDSLQYVKDSFFARHFRYYNNFGYDSAKNAEDKTEEYINFDDAISDLRKDVEYKVFTELETLRKAEQTYSLKYETLKEQYNSDIVAFIKEHNDRYCKLMKEYTDLKEDKDTRKTEEILKEKIAKLEKDLSEEKAKKWYHKLF